MSYPRLAIDRDSESPRFGTIYVIGLSGAACASVVVATSLDGGRSFGEPHTFDACVRWPSVDVLIADNGTLFLATWGPTILRSTDGGLTWRNLTTLDTANSPASLGWDPATGALHAAWTSPGTGGWGFDPGSVLVAVSSDGGDTWSTPRSVLPGDVTGDGAQIAAHGDQSVVAFLVQEVGGVRVATVASDDGGTTWGTPVFVSRADPCNAGAAPSIAASDSGLFAVSWYEDAGSHASHADCSAWGEEVQTFVSVSEDRGASFSPPILAGGPPGWRSMTFGDALAFDNRSAAYVAWHSIAPTWNPAYVNVAVSDDAVSAFEASNFTVAMTVAGGNSTQQENLAAGPGDAVYLLWEAYSTPSSPEEGIFVRRVAGEVSGDVALMPGVPEDVPITVEFQGSDTTRVVWNGSRIVLPDVPPAAYSVSVTWGNESVPLGTIPVRAWALTTFAIRVGEPPPRGIPVWVALVPAAVVVGVAAYAYVRASRTKRGS